MKYITTSSYDLMIGTIPNLQADALFLDRLSSALEKNYKRFFSNGIGSSSADQKLFIDLMDESTRGLLSMDGEMNMFSDVPDHYNRPMRRYIIDDEDNKWNYILDVFATLDVSLEISTAKRFFLTHLPWKVSKLHNEEFVPTISYKYRVWNTPVSYYLIDLYTAPMTAQYSSKIERARQLIGLPKIYDSKELKNYERVDYYIRRALFHEVTNVPKSGSSGESQTVS